MRNNIIAIMYDFDKTLCTRDMQEYTFFPNLGLDAEAFWDSANKLRENNKMDHVLSYMYLMFRKTVDNNRSLKRDFLNDMGKDIELFPGVIDWFDRINEYGKSLGFEIEHYIISSGLKEIIEGSKIGNKFKSIFASEFFYNEDGNAMWPKLAVNYTNKTQFLMRINKGILDISDDNGLNDMMLENDRRISTSNMIYLGDGYTDVPCMKLTKENGGVSIAVYTDKNIKTVKKLLHDGRINYMAQADYNDGTELDKIIKKTIKAMAINTELKNISYKQAND
ncbi:MAG: haloacid dehalogenase-like hydrolase [Bacilli bacterium]|nr:haloacid dehalogenase-like hydrolase [Bacilli bacterium]